MLSNRLALITGAASGIGLSTAHLYAQEGANLALVDWSQTVHQTAAELTAKYPSIKVTSHICDVTNSEQVTATFTDVHAKHSAVPTISECKIK